MQATGRDMPDFVQAARVSQLPASGKMTLEVGDRMVVLVRVGDRYYCLDDVCTHDGGPLGEGELCGFELACPRHGARFDVRNGRALTMPATVDTLSHDVKVVGDEIWVRLKEE
jgi:3-phenylpropionate/trans-cinnamate dioxygenase ferredoxin subunit